MRRRIEQIAPQCGQRRCLAFDGQPEKNLLLQVGQARKVLVEHGANVIKDQRIIGQEFGHVTAKELVHRIRHQFERQGIARVARNQQRFLIAIALQPALQKELATGLVYPIRRGRET